MFVYVLYAINNARRAWTWRLCAYMHVEHTHTIIICARTRLELYGISCPKTFVRSERRDATICTAESERSRFRPRARRL